MRCTIASAALKDDREIVLEAVKQEGLVLKYAKAALKEDEERGALKYASAALKDDREIVLEAVKHNGKALYYASTELRNGGLRVRKPPEEQPCSTSRSRPSSRRSCSAQRQRRRFQVRLLMPSHASVTIANACCHCCGQAFACQLL